MTLMVFMTQPTAVRAPPRWRQGHNDELAFAVGALLCHLPHICHHTTPEHAQIWTLRVAQKNHEEVQSHLDKIAQRSSTTVAKIVADNRVPNSQLRKTEPP